MSDTESGCLIAAVTAAMQRGSDWHGSRKVPIDGSEHQASCTASKRKGEAVARRAHLSANDSVASSCRSSGERATVSRSGCICTVVLVVG